MINKDGKKTNNNSLDSPFGPSEIKETSKTFT